jgi:hypothetical protein
LGLIVVVVGSFSSQPFRAKRISLHITQFFGGLQSDLREVQSHLRGLQSDLREVQSHLRRLQSDLRRLQSHLRRLQSDLRGVQRYLRGVRSDLRSMRTDFGGDSLGWGRRPRHFFVSPERLQRRAARGLGACTPIGPVRTEALSEEDSKLQRFSPPKGVRS